MPLHSVQPRGRGELGSFTRFVVSGACLLCLAGPAPGQEAREFWQNEWSRPQPGTWGQSGQSGWGRPAWQERRTAYGGQDSYVYGAPQTRVPRQRAAPIRRAMPKVHVSNPDFYSYTPDP